jgi:hypothetical protein
MVKTSILVYYKALFKRYDMVKWIVWATLLVVNIGALALTMLFLLECKPVGASAPLVAGDYNNCSVVGFV